MEADYSQTQSDFVKVPPDQYTYREKLIKHFPNHSTYHFHADIEGPGNLEYLIAQDDYDLSRGLVQSHFTTPEERAYQLLNLLIPSMFIFLKDPDDQNPFAQIFLKYIQYSRMGTHCIFGLQYKGFEIEEHSFAVHIDNNNRVVMVCCTYLPNLPSMLIRDSEFQAVEEEKIKTELKNIKPDNADAEKLWLIIWDEESNKYILAPGVQVKLRLPDSDKKRPTVLRISATRKKELYNSPGLSDQKIGLGEIIRDFLETNNLNKDILDDGNIKKYQVILQDLESGSELIGKYAAIKDEINNYNEDRKGIFINESKSSFDRVTAYYHLDYIQRYFREKLGLSLLDEYPHLSPAQIVLSYKSSPLIAQYDVNREKIIFYQLGSKGFTAVRDPRFIYHEFLHMVTDAIARLHRGDKSPTPRSRETLQAQAMDEGTADYFACSLAKLQGAKKAFFYFPKRGKWVIRNLQPTGYGGNKQKTINIQIADWSADEETWKTKKYDLGEWWGRYLWQIRKSLGAEVTDMLVAHSLFFLTRWATLEQGFMALQLADRLLFSNKHKEAIDKIEII
jgi:hypothetical protein